MLYRHRLLCFHSGVWLVFCVWLVLCCLFCLVAFCVVSLFVCLFVFVSAWWNRGIADEVTIASFCKAVTGTAVMARSANEGKKIKMRSQKVEYCQFSGNSCAPDSGHFGIQMMGLLNGESLNRRLVRCYDGFFVQVFISASALVLSELSQNAPLVADTLHTAGSFPFSERTLTSRQVSCKHMGAPSKD